MCPTLPYTKRLVLKRRVDFAFHAPNFPVNMEYMGVWRYTSPSVLYGFALPFLLFCLWVRNGLYAQHLSHFPLFLLLEVWLKASPSPMVIKTSVRYVE